MAHEVDIGKPPVPAGQPPEQGKPHQFGLTAAMALIVAAKTGRRAAIGSLADIAGIVAGTAGTNVARRRAAEDAGPGSSAGR